MNKFALILVHAACAFMLITAACSNPMKERLQGKWRSKDGTVKLNITSNSFTMDDGEALAEQYYIKGDSVFTSYEGNEPYTRFVVQQLDDHNLKLMGPDSVAVDYSR
jgi:hypothetical protein